MFGRLIGKAVFIAIMLSVQGVASQTNIMWTKVGSTMQQATS